LIKRVYEVDPLVCAKCGGQMKIISFIERGQRDGADTTPLRSVGGSDPHAGYRARATDRRGAGL